MLMLTITDNIESIIISNRDDAIDLELKLNVTSKGRLWSNIGDTLYNFTLNHLVITTEQLSFLKMLQSMPNWDSCRGF